MVADREIEYYQCKRLEKPVIALEIVQAVRASGGRFLKKNESTGLYDDVGDRKAREKTSQALRERAPEIKKQFDAAGGEGCKVRGAAWNALEAEHCFRMCLFL